MHINSEVSYDLDWSFFSYGIGCGYPDGLHRGIEFAVRTNTNGGPWIPLWLEGIDIDHQNINSVVIRGYEVPATFSTYNGSDFSPVYPHRSISVSICGNIVETNDIQFRWMGTSDFDDNLPLLLARNDGWALTRVSVVLVRENERTNIIEEEFGCSNPPCSLE